MAFSPAVDLNGPSSGSNPHDAFIRACNDDPAPVLPNNPVPSLPERLSDPPQFQAEIIQRYDSHRTARAAQQRSLLTAPEFPGVSIDSILRQVLDEEARPTDLKTGYKDPRHCLVLWARPPERIKTLIGECQRRLKHVVPNMYYQPAPHLHLTVLELAHSLTPTALATLTATLSPSLTASSTDLPHTLANPPPSPTSGTPPAKLARLHKPLMTYDANAIALSFLPLSPPSPEPPAADPRFTYQHLRSTLYAHLHAHGIPIASRYTVPSAHLTIARFVSRADTDVEASRGEPSSDPARMRAFVECVDAVNAWLQAEYWPKGVDGGTGVWMGPGEWTVGEEKGLDFREGRLWYGGGETMRLGRGI